MRAGKRVSRLPGLARAVVRCFRGYRRRSLTCSPVFLVLACRRARAEIRAGLCFSAPAAAASVAATSTATRTTSTAGVGRGRGRRGAGVGSRGRGRWCHVGRAALHRVDELARDQVDRAVGSGLRTRPPIAKRLWTRRRRGKLAPSYQRSRWTTSSNGRRFGRRIGRSGRSAG
jgi:hypothetical protein